MVRYIFKKYIVLAACVIGFFATISYGQSVGSNTKVTANFSQDTIMIGDQLVLRVTIERDMMQQTQFPNFENGLGGAIEIIAEGSVDTISRDGRRLILRKDYVVTSFDAGYYNIGKFPLLLVDKNIIDTIYSTDSLLLFVNTFLIDSTKHKIVDVTSPIDAPLQFAEVKNYVFGGIVLLLIITLIIYLIRKYRKHRALGGEAKEVIPPHINAINELEKIYSLKLWKEGKQKIYYTAIADILREYLEGRFLVSAMEMTTDEIMKSIKDLDITPNSKLSLQDMLMLADLVKFAKFAPDEQQCDQSFKSACDFVERTKPLELGSKANDTDEQTKK